MPDRSDTQAPADRGGTLRWGIQQPQSIVPSQAVGDDALHIVNAVFDSLTAYDADLVPVPAAAAWWASDPAHRVWRFRLRDDATFHDGTPVTAGDFAFAWQLAVRAGNVYLADVEGYGDVRNGLAGRFRGVEAADAHTLVVRLSEPRADFPAVVAHPSLAPVPRAAWQTDSDGFARQPVGNGPFRVAEEWTRDQFIRLVRFPEWPGWSSFGSTIDVPDEVLFRIADIDTNYLSYQQGRVDIAELPNGAFSQAVDTYGRSADGYRGPGVLDGHAASLYFLGFNVTEPPFDDVTVRRAVSLAIDRDALADALLEGNIEPARGAWPAGLPGSGRPTCRSCVHSPETARRLFTNAGVTWIRLWLNDDGGHEAVAERVVADLAAVGVDVVLRERDFEGYLDALRSGTPGLFRFGWAAESAEPGFMLQALFHSASIPPDAASGANYMRYANDRVDEVLEEARRERDRQRRRELWRAAERIAVGEDQAIVPLFTYRHRMVVADHVRGFVLDPLGLAALEDVRLAPTG